MIGCGCSNDGANLPEKGAVPAPNHQFALVALRLPPSELPPGEVVEVVVEFANSSEKDVQVGFSNPSCGCRAEVARKFQLVEAGRTLQQRLPIVGIPGREEVTITAFVRTADLHELVVECPIRLASRCVGRVPGEMTRIDHPDGAIQFSVCGQDDVDTIEGSLAAALQASLYSNAYSIDVLEPEKGCIDMLCVPLAESSADPSIVAVPPFSVARSGVSLVFWPGDSASVTRMVYARRPGPGRKSWRVSLPDGFDLSTSELPEIAWISTAAGVTLSSIGGRDSDSAFIDVTGIAIGPEKVHLALGFRGSNGETQWWRFDLLP